MARGNQQFSSRLNSSIRLSKQSHSLSIISCYKCSYIHFQTKTLAVEPQGSLADVQRIDTSMEQNPDMAAQSTAEQTNFIQPRVVPDDTNDDENGIILSSLSKMDTQPESYYEVKVMSLAFAVFLYGSKRKCQ